MAPIKKEWGADLKKEIGQYLFNRRPWSSRKRVAPQTKYIVKANENDRTNDQTHRARQPTTSILKACRAAGPCKNNPLAIQRPEYLINRIV